jgi:adenosylcobinamide hydrolase
VSSDSRPIAVRPLLVDLTPSVGAPGPCLVWRLDQPMLAISSSIVGGGIGNVRWVINMTVDSDYSRLDSAAHLIEVAASLGLSGDGIGLMTAVDVGTWGAASMDGASVTATVGVHRPVWASDRLQLPAVSTATRESPPGTINLVAELPVRLSLAALVNVVATVTEAKVQALLDERVPGTGTASDAICVLCPPTGGEELFGGPRSVWGSRLADATYRVVTEGIVRQRG